MSEAKWTPGPWVVFDKNRIREIHAVDEVVVRWSGFDGCDLPDTQIAANARLIAAAPDLYEALAELVERRERACREWGGPVDGSDGRYARARAALAKARGKS